MSGVPRSGSERIVSLDGLRGIAALVVVFGHSVGATGMSGWDRLRLFESPLVVLLNAIGAVHLFFVLSGACLAGSAHRSTGAREGTQFYIRRIFRIQPPYMFALLVAWGLSILFVPVAPFPASGLSDWITPYLDVQLSGTQLLQGLAFPSTAFEQMPVGWTLQVEMVFSLLLPAMMWISRQSHWSILVALSLGILLVEVPHFTLAYALDFSLGIAVYEERARLSRVFERLPSFVNAGVLLCAVGLLTLPAYQIASFAWWAILPFGLGSAVLVAGAIHVRGLRRPLELRPAAWVGRVSYSLYLLHFSILLVCAPLLARPLGFAAGVGLALLVAVLSTAAATLSYRVIERPSIHLGNRLCGLFARRFGVAEQASRAAAEGFGR